jgi:phosphoglycerate dehydrogenase-like enzyme
MVDGLAGLLFSDQALRRMAAVSTADPGLALPSFDGDDARARLESTEVLITGWGAPRLDADFLAAAPRLRAVVHACGTVKPHVTPESYARGIVVSSAAAANAKPVAEYTVAMILLAGKDVFAMQALYEAERRSLDPVADFLSAGNYGRRVGVVGASMVGRRVIELLAPYDVTVFVADPFLDAHGALALGAQLVELDELMATCDIVSLHAPELPSTYRMLDRRRLALMRDGATFINTSRGSLVEEEALFAELVSGRLRAVLDVTEVEPLPSDSPLWSLPNVVLTPHVAGALGVELQRQGDAAVAELERYAVGAPFTHPVLEADLGRLA